MSLTLVVLLGCVYLANCQPPPTPAPWPAKVTLTGHSETVYAIAYRPDGKQILTGSFDLSARLWDANTGKLVKSFGGATGHTNTLLTVAFAPDGQTFLTGSSDNSLRLWDVPGDVPRHTLTLPAGVSAITVSADGTRVAVGTEQGGIKVANAVDGKDVATLAGGVGAITATALSGDGKWLLAGGADGSVRFINPANGALVTTVVAHSSPIQAVAIHPGNTLAFTTGTDGVVKFWPLPPPLSKPLPAHADAATAVAFTADGSGLFTAGADKAVRVFNTANGQAGRPFEGLPSPAHTLAAAGTHVAVGATDGTLVIWGPDAKPLAVLPAHTGAITGLALTGDGKQLTSVGADGVLKTWSLPPLPTKAYAHPDAVRATLATADGKRLFTASADKIVRQFKLSDNNLERQFAGHTSAVTALALNPAGDILATAGIDDGIRLWAVATGKESARLVGHVGPLTNLFFANNGLLSTSADGVVKFWQVPPAAPKVFAHPDAVAGQSLLADGKRLLTLGNDKQVRLWNLGNGTVERQVPTGAAPALVAVLNADASLLALATPDKNVSIVKDGKELKKFLVPALAKALAWSADSKNLIVGGADGTLKLFDWNAAKETKSVAAHANGLAGMLLAAKGDVLVSTGADNHLRWWNAGDLTPRGQAALPAAGIGLALSADGTHAIALTGPAAILLPLAEGKTKPALALNPPATSIAVAPNGSAWAVGSADGKVRVFDPAGQLLEWFAHDAAVTSVAFTPDGKALTSTSADKSARLWSRANAWSVPTGVGLTHAVVVGANLAVSGADGQVRWLDATGKLIRAAALHAGGATALAATADGRWVASTGADKSVKVQQAADGKIVATLALPAAGERLALSADGKRTAVASAGQVLLFDSLSGRALVSVPSAGPVRSLSFAADQRQLVIAGDDKQARLVDPVVQAAYAVHAGGATGAYYHPSAQSVYSAGADKTIKLTNLADGQPVRTLPLPGPATAFTVAKDGAVVAAASGKVVKVWQADGKELATFTHPADVTALNLSADRLRLVSGATDNLARVWDIATGKEVQAFPHGAAVRAVAFHPTTPTIATASADKSVNLHPIAVARLSVIGPAPVRSLAPSTSGNTLIVAGDEPAAKGINTTNGNPERAFEATPGPITGLALNKGGQFAALAGADGHIRIFTAGDGKFVAQFKVSGPVKQLAFHPTQPLLVGALANAATLWNVNVQPGQPIPPEFGTVVESFASAGPITGLGFTGDGNTLVTGSADKTARVWKLAASVPIRKFDHPNLVDTVAYHPGGKLAATGCHDGNVRIWDIERGPVVRTIAAHTTPAPQPIYCVVWAPDGKSLVSTCYDGGAKLWGEGGNLIREFRPYKEKEFDKGHREAIFTAVFTPDGKFLYTGSSDKLIKKWDVNTGQVVQDLVNPAFAPPAKNPSPLPVLPQSHPGWVYALRLTPDGKTLVSGGSANRLQGYLALWNAEGKLVRGQEVPFGPIYNLAIAPDGKAVALGCGANVRGEAAANGIVVPLP
jgi:WD40 repeat protein